MTPVRTAAAPVTYQEWLDCLARLREAPSSGGPEWEALAHGSFEGTEAMRAALERQIAQTVNALLNRSVRRFVRALDERLAFHDLSDLDLLFQRLRREIHRSTFFLDLPFLSDGFRSALYRSVAEEMTAFWADTLRVLRRQAMECASPDLEDALFLIGRIRLDLDREVPVRQTPSSQQG